MRTLVVDDKRSNGIQLKGLISEFSEVEIARNGKDAVELCKIRLNEGKYFDMIFLDIVMPVMDGHLALAEIRDIEKAWAKKNSVSVEEISSRIIMITAYINDDNEVMSMCSKADGSIVKPISKDKVIDIFEKFDLI